MAPSFLKPAGEASFRDSMMVKFGDGLKSWKGESIKGYGLIGLPLSKPSISHSGASFAPEVMRTIFKNMATYAIEEDMDLGSVPLYDLGDVQMHVTDLKVCHNRIESTLFEVTKANPKMIPIILGGDHSITCPAFTGYTKASDKRVGLIQFDAHHDVRNREDGGPSNGTPFRGLLESGILKGNQLVQIGLRNFSNSEAYTNFAKDEGVVVYTMKEVRQKGLNYVVKEAYSRLAEEVDVIYLSVDIDVLDQAFAPGCPAIGPGGMHPDDLFEALNYLGSQSKTRAIDLVEIDPKQDFRDMTSRIGVFAFLSFMIGKEKSESQNGEEKYKQN
jgi:formiminoglutamase